MRYVIKNKAAVIACTIIVLITLAFILALFNLNIDTPTIIFVLWVASLFLDVRIKGEKYHGIHDKR
jgi:hypothetical protein